RGPRVGRVFFVAGGCPPAAPCLRPGTPIVLQVLEAPPRKGAGAHHRALVSGPGPRLRKRRTIMKRKVLCGAAAVLGGVLLGFGVQRAAAADDCLYKGTKYSEGAASCQTGIQFRCQDGEWKALGVACSDDRPA